MGDKQSYSLLAAIRDCIEVWGPTCHKLMARHEIQDGLRKNSPAKELIDRVLAASVGQHTRAPKLSRAALLGRVSRYHNGRWGPASSAKAG